MDGMSVLPLIDESTILGLYQKNEGFSGCKNHYQMKSCEAAGNPSGNQFQVNSLSSAFLVTERETLR
jgi:hypothetical protein